MSPHGILFGVHQTGTFLPDPYTPWDWKICPLQTVRQSQTGRARRFRRAVAGRGTAARKSWPF